MEVRTNLTFVGKVNYSYVSILVESRFYLLNVVSSLIIHSYDYFYQMGYVTVVHTEMTWVYGDFFLLPSFLEFYLNLVSTILTPFNGFTNSLFWCERRIYLYLELYL